MSIQANRNAVNRPEDFFRQIFSFLGSILQNTITISEIVSQIFEMIRKFFQMVSDFLADVANVLGFNPR